MELHTPLYLQLVNFERAVFQQKFCLKFRKYIGTSLADLSTTQLLTIVNNWVMKKVTKSPRDIQWTMPNRFEVLDFAGIAHKWTFSHYFKDEAQAAQSPGNTNSKQFCYLESIIAKDDGVDSDVMSSIKKVWQYFASLNSLLSSTLIFRHLKLKIFKCNL